MDQTKRLMAIVGERLKPIFYMIGAVRIDAILNNSCMGSNPIDTTIFNQGNKIMFEKFLIIPCKVCGKNFDTPKDLPEGEEHPDHCQDCPPHCQY